MNTFLIVLLVIVGVIVLMIAIGYITPVKHIASITEEIKLPINKLYKVLTNTKNYTKWRPELKEVKVMNAKEWIEISKYGEMGFSFTELEENKKIVATIKPDKALQFGGYWVYELEATEDKVTQLTITEHGEVYSPFFRFISKYIMGHKGNLKRMMENLKDEVGD